MSLSDDPLSVSTGQEWAAVRGRVRVPIYVTANDLTCLYAPLVREGRMDKFYFEPDRLEMAGALQHLFDPHLSRPQVWRRHHERAPAAGGFLTAEGCAGCAARRHDEGFPHGQCPHPQPCPNPWPAQRGFRHVCCICAVPCAPPRKSSVASC
jgi:hypothetical protein